MSRLVVDDMVSFDPFIVRGIRVYGYADKPAERGDMQTTTCHVVAPCIHQALQTP
jgi:pyridoxamine 5'-phosphate oxidase family protein